MAGATEVLRRIHPQVTVPAASKWAVTRWGGDRFTRGAYSYVAVGADGGAYDAMRKSCGDGGVIMFAGEHTCKSHPDTVGGAMLTGLMAAREALQVRGRFRPTFWTIAFLRTNTRVGMVR